MLDKALIRLNTILFYADFLSLKDRSIPITDTCTYFFIHGFPINSSYLANVEPFYHEDNAYYKQSYTETSDLKSAFGEDGMESFLDEICNLKVSGKVNAYDMLKCIHRYSTRGDRNKAIKKYNTWYNNLKYYTETKDDDCKTILKECSKHVAHQNNAKGIVTESNFWESVK